MPIGGRVENRNLALAGKARHHFGRTPAIEEHGLIRSQQQEKPGHLPGRQPFALVGIGLAPVADCQQGVPAIPGEANRAY